MILCKRTSMRTGTVYDSMPASPRMTRAKTSVADVAGAGIVGAAPSAAPSDSVARVCTISRGGLACIESPSGAAPSYCYSRLRAGLRRDS